MWRLTKKLIIFEPISIALRIILFIIAAKSISYIVFNVGRSILFYPYGALWYIQALIVAVLILIPFIKYGKERYALYIGLLLYCYALLCNRYFFLVDGSIFEAPIRGYLYIFVSARNGLFVGLLYVSMGLLISKYWNTIKSQKAISTICLLLGYCGFVAEVYLLQGKTGIDDNALYIMMVCVIPSLFLVAAQCNISCINDTKALRNLSTSIYLLHSPFRICIDGVYKVIIGHPMQHGMLTILTLSVILLICMVVYKSKVQPLYNWIK